MKLTVTLASAVAIFAIARGALAHSHCSETSDVVGYERCTRFGDGWAVDRRLPIGLGVGFEAGQLNLAGLDFTSSHDKKSQSFAFRYPGSTSVWTQGLALRLEGTFLGPLYGGVDFGFGFGENRFSQVQAASKTSTDRVSMSASDALINTTAFHAGAFLGARLPLGRVSLRFETVFGASWLALDQVSGGVDYVATVIRPSIVPRLTFDVWATGNVTMGLYGGIDATNPQNRSFGLLFEFHARSFDGTYALW